MRLSTKNVLLMIALLSVNLVEGNKCIVKPSSKSVAVTSAVADAAESTIAPVVIDTGVESNKEEEEEDINDAPVQKSKSTAKVIPKTAVPPSPPVHSPIPEVATTKVIPKTALPPSPPVHSPIPENVETVAPVVKKTTTTVKKTTTSKKTITTTTTKKTTTIKKTTTTTSKAVAPSSSSSKSGKSGKSLPDITKGTTGKTTRYWDCCLASCAWKENTNGSHVKACKADGVTLVTDELYKVRNGCEDGGQAYMCNDNQPWAINDKVSYGFVAAAFQSGSQKDWCCSCYRMQFTSGAAKGKQMIVQVTNTGYDLSDNHFDIQMPGGGVGVFNGCQSQWKTSVDGWGQRYGGISGRSECENLPKQLRDGCYWRYDWFLNSDNPSVIFERVQCPTELTSKSGCVPPDNSKYKAIPWN
jgi:hypothetical protein